MVQQIFERCENKYLMTAEQRDRLMERLKQHVRPDRYGEYPVANLYFDTEEYDLIRMSLEKPVYKEKLRLRSYGKAAPDSRVFLELKKKFQGVVYKRRETLLYQDAMAGIKYGNLFAKDTQIGREIQYFAQFYQVEPTVYICYERKAYTGINEEGLRITFDTNIRFRQSELRLDNGSWGIGILKSGTLLMEVKTPGAMPLWFARAISELGIYPSSFSKYGICYENYILPRKNRKAEVIASA